MAFWDAPFQGLYDLFGASGAQYETPPANPNPALANEAYIGSYRNDYMGEIEIAAGGDGLELHIGPGPQVHPLTHWDRDTFTRVSFPEPPAPLAGVIFTMDPMGMGLTVQLEDFSGDPGFFTRVEPEG